MGFQRPPSYKQKQQSVPKTAKEVEDQGDSFINTRIPYLSPTTNEPIAFDSYYNSWVVSFFSIHAYSKHIYIYIYILVRTFLNLALYDDHAKLKTKIVVS
jgi:hypothetical protein